MKNEQQNTQNDNGGQQNKHASINIQPDDMQVQKSMQTGPSKKQSSSQSTGNENSNINVSNDGTISKDDQWNTGNDQQYDQNQRNNDQDETVRGNRQKNQAEGDKTDPESQSTGYGQQDNNKRVPQPESNKNSK